MNMLSMSAIADPEIRRSSVLAFKCDDGGRGISSWRNEKNDCVVRAISIAKGWLYDDVHEELQYRGRKNRRRTKNKTWRAYADQIMVARATPRMTVAKFLREYPTGTYVVHVAHHAFAIVDGVIHDIRVAGSRQIIKSVWSLV